LAQDNENDEYHAKVSRVDVWAEYARLRDEEDWLQERIAKAKRLTSHKWVSERLKYYDELPEKIKDFVRQEKLTEGHLEKITSLCVDAHFSPWLTTEQLWLKLANEATKESLSVAKLKEQKASSMSNHAKRLGINDFYCYLTIFVVQYFWR
jgi:hypothetical protein